MSKRNDGELDGAVENGWPNETPDVAGQAAATPAGVSPTFLAIEEHVKNQNVSAPIFAAVKTMKGWREGKKVEEAEFKEAVKAFLGAPMGGMRNGIA